LRWERGFEERGGGGGSTFEKQRGLQKDAVTEIIIIIIDAATAAFATTVADSSAFLSYFRMARVVASCAAGHLSPALLLHQTASFSSNVARLSMLTPPV
jgi:hypothetical protein